MAKTSEREGASVEIALYGLVSKLGPLGKFSISQVHDLVDVIHHLESRHAFLKKIKYQVNVNDVLVDKNQQLFSGDKIVIQPKTNVGT